MINSDDQPAKWPATGSYTCNEPCLICQLTAARSTATRLAPEESAQAQALQFRRRNPSGLCNDITKPASVIFCLISSNVLIERLVRFRVEFLAIDHALAVASLS